MPSVPGAATGGWTIEAAKIFICNVLEAGQAGCTGEFARKSGMTLSTLNKCTKKLQHREYRCARTGVPFDLVDRFGRNFVR
jgi:hypothetical protein